jgi:hypothetical protein
MARVVHLIGILFRWWIATWPLLTIKNHGVFCCPFYWFHAWLLTTILTVFNHDWPSWTIRSFVVFPKCSRFQTDLQRVLLPALWSRRSLGGENILPAHQSLAVITIIPSTATAHYQSLWKYMKMNDHPHPDPSACAYKSPYENDLWWRMTPIQWIVYSSVYHGSDPRWSKSRICLDILWMVAKSCTSW